LAIYLRVLLGFVLFGFWEKADAMLKVTKNQAESAETWELEGKLSGDWVKELERCWKERSSPAGVSLQIHLKAVSYIDAAGKRLLTEMHGRGVEIKGCGCMSKAVVEEITRHASAN
jgi:ABC-type transporter Mla MlaB component